MKQNKGITLVALVVTIGIRPIVYLNSELRTKGKDENGIYRILEQ